MLCSSYFAEWAKKSWLCVNTIPWASWIDSRRVDDVEGSASFLLLISLTIRPLSINPKSFHNKLNHSYTNQFYVDERQIHLHSYLYHIFYIPFVAYQSEWWSSSFRGGMAPVGAVICGIILAERWAGPWRGQLSHLAEPSKPIGQGSYEDNTRFVSTLQRCLPTGNTASGLGMTFKTKTITS